MAMTNERFNEILEQNFDFGYEVRVSSSGEINNYDSQTGYKLTDQTKSMVQSLKVLSLTDKGEELLESLDPNTKIGMYHLKDKFDENGNKISGLGEHCGNNIAAYESGIRQGVFGLSSTLFHELIHEKQRQDGINSGLCDEPQNAFMIDKLQEAEARIKTAEFAEQLKNGAVACGIKEEKVSEQMKSCVNEDMSSIVNLTSSGLSEEEVNREMLKKVYNDERWNEAYNEQALINADFENYSNTKNMYREKLKDQNGMSDAEMFEQMMYRMSLKKEDAQYFADPQNISAFPSERFAKNNETQADDRAQMKANLGNSLSGVSCEEVAQVETQPKVNVAQMAMNNIGGR